MREAHQPPANSHGKLEFFQLNPRLTADLESAGKLGRELAEPETVPPNATLVAVLRLDFA